MPPKQKSSTGSPTGQPNTLTEDFVIKLNLAFDDDDSADEVGLTPLHIAAKNGDGESLIRLFQEGFGGDYPGHEYSPLELAFIHNQKYCAYLIHHHGGVFYSNNIFDKPIDSHIVLPELKLLSLITVVRERYIQKSVVEQIGYQNLVLDMEHKPHRVGKANQMDSSNGYSDLVKAILRKDEAEFKQILLGSSDALHQKGIYGLMPIHWAALRGDSEMMRTLLIAGANPNAMTDDQLTPMHFAALNTSSAISCLLHNGAKAINPKGINGWTPMHIAARYNCKDSQLGMVAAMHRTRITYNQYERTDSGKSCPELELEWKDRKVLAREKRFEKPPFLPSRGFNASRDQGTGNQDNRNQDNRNQDNRNQDNRNQPLLTNDGTSNDNDDDNNHCFSCCPF